MSDSPVRGLFPKVSVNKGGLIYKQPTAAEREAADSLTAFVQRVAARVQAMQDEVINAACEDALIYGWDVHIYRPRTHFHFNEADRYRAWASTCIGISFETAKYMIPTIVEHLDHDITDYYDDWWNDDAD